MDLTQLPMPEQRALHQAAELTKSQLAKARELAVEISKPYSEVSVETIALMLAINYAKPFANRPIPVVGTVGG